jgi:hypothetical protein
VTLSAEKRRTIDAILEPAIREVERKLVAAGFCVEAGILLTVIVPKDEAEFITVEWRLWQEGMPGILDRAVHDALTIAPTSWFDAVKRGVS